MRMIFQSATKQLGSHLNLRRRWPLVLLAMAPMALSAQVSPAASDLLSSQQVIGFLAESIDWYHLYAMEGQIVTEPVDSVFLEDSRPSAGEILQLSFNFASRCAVFESQGG